ncbi:MAG: ABC transporter ATP-binding protein [Ruminococcus sp.]|nr:ABC transporter ATP-binding protein [Ruminococcus sp.]
MIIFKNISKVYQMGDQEVHALDNINIHIKKGEFVSIIGPSGSGKSTLMNIIGCLDTASDGQYLLDNLSIDSYKEKDLAKIRNRKIGFIFQNFNLIQKMSVYENVELPLIYQGVKSSERKKRVEQAIERVNLSYRMNHKPVELSGGQQQRVSIARAIVTNPSILLADEPTGALDSKTSFEIIDIFKELNSQGNTVVLITHDNKVALQAKRRICILDGKVDDTIADDKVGDVV